MINNGVRSIFSEFNEVRHIQEKNVAKWLIGKYYLKRCLHDLDNLKYLFWYGKIEAVTSVRLQDYQIDVEIKRHYYDEEAGWVDVQNINGLYDSLIETRHLGCTEFILETEEDVLNKMNEIREDLNRILNKVED